MRIRSMVLGVVLGLPMAGGVGGCGKKEAPPAAQVDAAKAPEAPAAQADAAVAKAPEPKAPAAEADAGEAAPKAEAEVAKAPEPAADPKDAKQGGAPKPGDAKKPRAKLKKEDREQAKSARAAFRELLDAGRKAVKGDDPLTGMQKLQEALTKVPGHPSALGELGWAAFRAGPAYFDTALDATRKALAASKKNKQKGALWYNLGRIAEDQGNLELAINAYRSSLANRPGNETVQKQLEALVAKLGGKDVSDGLDKLDDVCAQLREEQGCGTAASAEGFIMHSCDCGTELLGPEEGFGKAALMRITGSNEDMGGSVDSTYLLIESAAKWHLVAMVGNDWNPGMGYVSNASTRQAFEFKSVNGKPLLWVLFENGSDDLDPGVYTAYSDWSRTLTLCSVDGGKPTCLSVPLGVGSEISGFTFDESEGIPEGQGPEKEVKDRWSMTAELNATGELVIAVEEGADQLDDTVKGLPGTWSFDKLLGAPGVVKHEL